MSEIKIKEVKKDTIVKTGERFLNVKAEIQDGKTKVARNYSYPLGTTEKEIVKDLKKVLSLYDKEKAQAEAVAETDKAEAKADKTIEALEGVNINSN